MSIVALTKTNELSNSLKLRPQNLLQMVLFVFLFWRNLCYQNDQNLMTENYKQKDLEIASVRQEKYEAIEQLESQLSAVDQEI